jgi:uncharacterized repeat protein (TIGR01451 family)
MESNRVPKFKIKTAATLRRIGTSTLALMVFAAQVTPALATIDNTATASGTYAANPPTTATSTLVKVNVAPAVGSVSAAKSAGVPTTANGVAGIVDAGDTILYTYTITNTGNVTLTNVLPVDGGPKFNGVIGTNALGAFTPVGPATLPVTLIPGTSQDFTALYTMSAIDVDRAAGNTGVNAVTNFATGTGLKPLGGAPTSTTSPTVTVIIPAGPKLQVVKTFTLATAGGVPITPNTTPVVVGNVVTYKFTVTNTGNVPMTNVSISDLHVATTILSTTSMLNETLGPDGPLATATPAVPSVDGTANNGVWSTLQPGATVTFTWVHPVTQAEIDAG